MLDERREAVRQRAGNRCEYCGLPQTAAPFLAFHVEHIRARQHGGTDDLDNLALACPDCNAHKGPNITGIDPLSDDCVRLFNPRNDRWSDHFATDGPFIVGKTPIGRTTAALLDMNERERAEMRAELLQNGDL
jgi:hypothetical protein